MITKINIPGLSFLNTGVALANFHSDGKEDNDSDQLNNLHSGYINIDAASHKSYITRIVCIRHKYNIKNHKNIY